MDFIYLGEATNQLFCVFQHKSVLTLSHVHPISPYSYLDKNLPIAFLEIWVSLASSFRLTFNSRFLHD